MPLNPTDIADWTVAALAELAASQNDDGGWPYRAGGRSSTEATALAVLAISELEPVSTSLAAAVTYLQARRRTDGAFTISTECPDASWVTPLAAMALAVSAPVEISVSVEIPVSVEVSRSVDIARNYAISEPVSVKPVETASAQDLAQTADALLAQPVFVLDPVPTDLYGYDTSIPGWPWTPGDYSFVEPTSLAVIFLKQQGQSQHARVRQAMAALRTRALPGGGWNYGEPIVLGGTLYPTAAPTALALLATADEQDAQTAAALDWLSKQAATLTSLFSLGWAATAMNVLGRLDEAWQAEVVSRWQNTPVGRRNPLDTALCLLSLAPRAGHPFALV